MWSSYTIKNRLLIENVQRRATKFILNYPDNMSYVDRLQKTNLLPLDFRRDISDLTLLFKSKHHLITMDINKHLCTYIPGYQPRNYDQNNFYLFIKHNQEYFQNSVQVCFECLMFMNFVAFNNFLRIKSTCSFPFQSSCKFPKLPCLI